MQNQSQQIKTALISVSDKTHLIPFAQFLVKHCIQILSTGGSAKLLRENNIAVIEVSQFTGFPEIMGGRVKTLQPKIHGGILARRGMDDEVMKQHNIETIDLVVVNLYPFEKTIQSENCTLENAIENIDIGGPAMIRSAAKNHQWVSVICDISDYKSFMQAYENNNLNHQFRQNLAKKAFLHTSKYDNAIHQYLNNIKNPEQKAEFDNQFSLNFEKKMNLRYGENPHQQAAVYYPKNQTPSGLANAKQLQGKELSYNNFVDTDAAYLCLSEFGVEKKGCVIVKHANPCGVALSSDLLSAYDKAYCCDPTSAFGGILAFNDEVNDELASLIVSRQFAEVIIAPSFTKKAQLVFSKKKDLRLLQCPIKNFGDKTVFKKISGALLIQDEDIKKIDSENFQCVTEKSVDEATLKDLVFAFKVVKYVKSNAIIYAKDGQTLGIGAGQMSRVYAAKIAQIKAKDEGLNLTDSVMASDAFFPFKDSITMATSAGVKAIIQPGGSIRDKEVIDEANKQGIAMYFSGSRHFRH